jgi:hypothetical protein
MEAFLSKHRSYFLERGLPPSWLLNPDFDRIWRKIQNKREKPISNLGNHKKEIEVIPKPPKKEKPPMPMVRNIDTPHTKTITYPKPKLTSNITSPLIGSVYANDICTDLPDGVFLWIGIMPLH